MHGNLRDSLTAKASQHAGEMVYQARWLIPDGVACFSPGCLHLRHGRIVRVWEGADPAAVNLGDVAIVPGLINAHTHLEFSDLDAPLATAGGFPEWIRAVLQSRQSRAAERSVSAVIQRGWSESRTAGVVAVGEISTEDGGGGALASAGGQGVVYREVLGLRDEAVAAGLTTARNFLASDELGLISPTASARPCERNLREAGEESGTGRPALLRGLSPHAPYSLHPDLFRGLITLAVEARAPVAMHLAETREELELLAHHRGGLVDLLASLGLWRADLLAEFRRPLDYLLELSRCASTLVVHGNYLADDELDFLAAQPQMTVVYCPRTHAAFHHAPHPWLAMQQRGIRVVPGTDSRASNPDLSLWNELRWLHRRFPQVPAPRLLRMATCDAATALGLAEELGTLSPGRCAKLTLIRPTQPLTATDWSGLFDGTICRPPP